MQVRATKAGQYQRRFYKVGETFEIPESIFEQYKDLLSIWLEAI